MNFYRECVNNEGLLELFSDLLLKELSKEFSAHLRQYMELEEDVNNNMIEDELFEI